MDSSKKISLYYQGIFFLMRIPIRVLVSIADQITRSPFVPIGYQSLTWTVLPSLNLSDLCWFGANIVHIVNIVLRVLLKGGVAVET
jgi:hypothetical protein